MRHAFLRAARILTRLLLGAALLATSGLGGAPGVPPRDGLLVDAAGVLDPAREAALERELAATARIGYETAVVVVTGVEDRELLEYADAVLVEWRVGTPGRDPVGVVLAVDAASGQTAVATTDKRNPGRFSLFMPSLRLVSDQVRDGDPAGAVETAVRRLRHTLGDPSVTPDPAWATGGSREPTRGSRSYVGAGILAVAVAVVLLSTSRTRSRALDAAVRSSYGRTRRGGGGGTYGDFR